MRKTLIACTLLLAFAALVPPAFAAEAPAAAPALAAAPAAPGLFSPAASTAQPASDFALWLQRGQTGPIAAPSAICSFCQSCFDSGLDCCRESPRGNCYCCIL